MEVNSFMDFFIARNRANFEEIARPITLSSQTAKRIWHLSRISAKQRSAFSVRSYLSSSHRQRAKQFCRPFSLLHRQTATRLCRPTSLISLIFPVSIHSQTTKCIWRPNHSQLPAVPLT
jgi:hypothetical protein